MFLKIILERIQKLIITIDDKIREEKLEVVALSSGKIDKYEYLTGEEILPLYD